MAYEKLNLTNGTVLTADHLAHIEDGIASSAGGVTVSVNTSTNTLVITTVA